MTATPTPEPGERRWVCHKPGWMGPCSPQSTHHNGFDWGCGWIYFPAPSTPVEGTGEQRCVHCGQSPDDPGASMCQIDGISTGKLHDFQPGEGDGRPAHAWLDGRCIALHVPKGTRYAVSADGPEAVAQSDDGKIGPVCVIRWADGTTPAPPASPVPPTRPGADAVIRALIAACPSYGRGEGDTFRIEESAVVRLAREFLAAAPPTPTPCPYIVTGGEGTSYCSLAERSAMHAAAPPSTPAEQPQPDEQTVTIDEATAAWPLGMATAEQLAASKEKRPDADL